MTALTVTAPAATGSNGDVAAALKKAEKAPPPNMLKPERIGDTHIVVELTPADLSEPADLQLVAETPAGKSQPFALRAVPKGRLVAEREDDDGFHRATPFEPGQALAGAMNRKQDVDVWRFEGRPWRRFRFNVVAARRGSPFDPILTVYDANGTPLAEADDSEGRDPSLAINLAAGGPCFLAVSDALEAGNPASDYLIETAQE